MRIENYYILLLLPRSRCLVLYTLYFLCSLACAQSENGSSREPAVFLPELSATIPHIRDLTISRDGSQAYFTLESQKRNISLIVRIDKGTVGWSEPQVVSFSGQFRDIEPHLSQDGLQLYFASNRPLQMDDGIKDYDLWVVERAGLDETWPSFSC